MFSLVFDDDTPKSKSSSNPYSSFEYVLNQVFFPVHYDPTSELANDNSGKGNIALARAVHAAARAFNGYIDNVHQPDWLRITRMLDCLRVLIESADGGFHWGSWDRLDSDSVISQLGGMRAGDILMIAGAIFRRQGDRTLYEATPNPWVSGRHMVEGPELAIEVPNEAFDDRNLQSALAHSLLPKGGVYLVGLPEKSASNLLHSIGHPIASKCITKYLRPRLRLWFDVKFAIQSSLDRSPLGRGAYKSFMLFFMCNLADRAIDSNLSSVLLHWMSAKILRRFRKLGSPVPQWLSDTVSQTCTGLSRIVDKRWQEIQATLPTQCSSESFPRWDLSKLNVDQDTQFSLHHINYHISTSFVNRVNDPRHSPFLPDSCFRPTFNDFLSDSDGLLPRMSSLETLGDKYVMLYDFERAVGQDIDDWVACITNVDAACEQLQSLVRRCVLDIYPHWSRGHDPDHLSIILLTIIELWIALDRLVVKEIPILADYSPEVPMYLLRGLLLRDPMSIHRFCRTYQYIHARHSAALPGSSVFSDDLTEHSFLRRYYNTSPYLQRHGAHIADTLPPGQLRANSGIYGHGFPVHFATWHFVTNLISHADFRERFPVNDSGHVYKLPMKAPETLALQEYLGNTTHTSNEALAIYTPGYCGLSSHEFLAFAHLRSGGSLQWFNILRELRSRTLDVRRQEVYLLFAQAATQVGPLDGTGELLWHQEIKDASFCNALLDELESLFVDIGVGSLDGPAMATISLLAGILASAPPIVISERAVQLLRDVRWKTFDWVHELLCNMTKSSTDKGSLELLRDIAAVCRTTFDMRSTASYKLLSSAWDIEIALSCAILIRTISLSAPSGANTYSQVLLDRDRRLSLILEESLRDAIQADTTDLGVDRAIQLVWPGFRPGLRRWESLQPPNSRWLVCETAATRDRDSQLVHVNMLDGSLLVDGKPISVGSKLPSVVTRDSMYLDLFGDCDLMVVTSALPGMGFVTMSVFHKHYVHFAVREDRHDDTFAPNLLDSPSEIEINVIPPEDKHDGVLMPDLLDLPLQDNHDGPSTPGLLDLPLNDNRGAPSMPDLPRLPLEDNRDDSFMRCLLCKKSCEKAVIRAQSIDTNDLFELIPREMMQGSLPKPLVEGHFHWLNLSTSIIEVRPIDEPWTQSSHNWTIHLQPGQSHVTRRHEFLVAKQSRTWDMVSSHFRCLDDPENLIITTSVVDATSSPSSPPLSVTLPRYSLSFFVNEANNFESRDFKNMVYDDDQYIGTLLGLFNRLILRPKAQDEVDLIPKLILIPHGDSFDQRGDHVHVKLPSSGPVRYYTYQVDSELGCIKGIVSPESRVYLARLHALTSGGCQPDPLTGRTGIEEAISLIWSAGTRQKARPPGVSKSYESWCCGLQSRQICFVLGKIGMLHQRYAYYHSPSEDDLLREVYLFPSEITASIPRRRKEPLNSLDQLLHERPAPNLRRRNELPRSTSGFHNLHSPDIRPLRQLFSSLQTNDAAPSFQSQYISRLHNSTHHLQTSNPIGVLCRHTQNVKPGIATLRRHYVQCKINYTESLDIIKATLSPNTQFEQLLDRCGQWPRVTPFILFRFLASTSPIKPPENWRTCLISLALLALDVQQARRLLRFALDGFEDEFYHELETEGCDGWDPSMYPDWLLIQLQGDFLIRRVQFDIAKEMMSPRMDKNTVMQVNMGEGKTSVIIPICAAALADGSQLVRVIVPKALIPQTFQILTDRLCGLVNKPVYHLTFSRDQIDGGLVINPSRDSEVDRAESLQKLVTSCRDEAGVLVMQPEHVLSLKLACVETQAFQNEAGMNSTSIVQRRGYERVLHVLTGSLLKSLTRNTYVSSIIKKVKRWNREPETLEKSSDVESSMTMRAKGFLGLQRFLENHTRDILDESDDVLRPKFQLIYAVGRQHPFEGSPGRWLIVQQVLGLVKQHASLLSTVDSDTVRCDSSSPGSFPHIHILHTKGGEQLKLLVAQDVLDGRLPPLHFPSGLGFHGVIREFMLHRDIHPDTAKIVEQYARQSTSWDSLLLLRGLLAHDILLFALTQRRWRVDYGLDPAPWPRTMLSIPYRAKDVPSETAEFGHPDITILLTCLSYYYGGLSGEQLGSSFELLLQQEDPSSEYAFWLEDYHDSTSLPDELHKLSGVNIRSLEQWESHLVPLFSRNKRAIDLFLSRVVFPNHAKEFPQRISGTYWDIAEQKKHLVTGFSGTNDGQYLLPTSIVQDDPDHLRQMGTNARVLVYLQPENSCYTVTRDEDGQRWTTLELLKKIVAENPQIRVLLDVGAQILDLSNIELAKAWLDCTPATETAGAIYFSEDDRLMVIARNGIIQPLASSPLVQQLHRCVTYLDDAHTRGTDLMFPRDFRAAVTLGHKVTKDRLAQGCMRMRKLGHGHSVMFFAPHEVDRRIRGLVGKEKPNIPVTTADVLHWAINETWSDIQRQAPYWAQQGMAHQSRYELWSRFCQGEATSKQLGDVWVRPEVKSLAEMYMPSHSPEDPSSEKLPRQIREHCENLGVLSLRDIRMDEEQEREVSREIEHERQADVQVSRATPVEHSLHPDIVEFVQIGAVPSPPSSRAFRHIFATRTDNSLVASNGAHAWSPYILATADFCRAIEEGGPVEGRENNYLRPVQWVLSGKLRGRNALVLVSPYEANLLMPKIRISEHVHLHVYVPRTTKRMKPADDLRLYSVPPLPSDWTPPWDLIDQLNVFAGQFYLSDYASYVRLCRFLGIHTEHLPQKAGTVIARNWFSNPDPSDEEIKNRFDGTPLPLVMILLTARQGMAFAGTHMGRVLDGWPLSEEDFRGPLDVVKMKTHLPEQEQVCIFEDLVSVREDGEQASTTTRKRVYDSESAGRHSKRRRLN